MKTIFGLLRLSLLMIIVNVLTSSNLSAQKTTDDIKGAIELKGLPELKKGEYLPDVVQDMPLELRYFNGKEQERSSFRMLKEDQVQLFFWDASYPNHYTDLKRIYDYRERMGASSTVVLVISKKDKATLSKVTDVLKRFKKEFELETEVMDMTFIIGNPNLDKLFKLEEFPKYIQINPDALFISESSVDKLFISINRNKRF